MVTRVGRDPNSRLSSQPSEHQWVGDPRHQQCNRPQGVPPQPQGNNGDSCTAVPFLLQAQASVPGIRAISSVSRTKHLQAPEWLGEIRHPR